MLPILTSSADAGATASPLASKYQLIVERICAEPPFQAVDRAALREFAEQAVRDLQPSISFESLPEMASRLTRVRLAA